MQKITPEEIQKKIESLPENLRLAILISDIDKKVNTIGRENGLNVNQNTELLSKTHLVMLGFIHLDKFEDSVKEISEIPPQVVNNIVKDIGEQILKDIKDDLIALAEKPNELKSIPVETVLSVENQQDLSESANSLDGSGADWDKKNDEVLKSAGIEIRPLILNDEIQNTEHTKDKKEVEAKSEREIKNNEEIIKIAFENLEKKIPTPEEVRVPILDIKNEEIKKEKTPALNAFSIPARNATQNVAGGANAGGEPKEIPAPQMLPEFQKIKELEEIYIPIINLELKKMEEFKEISAPPVPLELKEAKEPRETTTPPVPIKIDAKKESEAINKEEKSLIFENKKEKPAPIRKTDSKLKLIVKNVINFYEAKAKNISPTSIPVYYTIKSNQKNKEEEIINSKNPENMKQAIVIEIVEIQNKMKIMKDRISEIIKEKDKLEKEKKELHTTEQDSAQISDINTNLSELYEEEKTIQKLRELDLPKEYLELLEKLDKLTVRA
jgi:hypothetical protein